MRAAIVVLCSLVACGCGGAPASPVADVPAAGPVTVVTLPAPSGDAMAATAPPLVTVSKDAAQVRLCFRGVDRPADELTAELEARDTGEVRRWPVDAAPADDGALSVTVPAYALGAGGHVLTIWAGDADVVRRYVLQVAVE